MSTLKEIYLGLGSNLGDKMQHLQNAVDLIADQIGSINQISSVYKTKSWGFEAADFYNAVLCVQSKFSAEAILKKTQEIELQIGREKFENHRFESRVIDIDILFIDTDILLNEHLVVPHPLLKKRRFVLEPFAEIAPQLIHPIDRKTIKTLLSECEDQGEVVKIYQKLTGPVSIFHKYKYIAIEGNIGTGKTSLTNLLTEDYNAKAVLERFADNPFLPKFYDEPERYALPTEMSFLADRYHQLSEDLAQFDLFKSFIISDYYIFKSLIFSQVTLPEDEFKLYRKIFDIMYKEITKPDLYIYLYQNTKRLMENIKKRGRDYEQNISEEYLQKIQNGYLNFIQTENKLNVLIIDVSEMDFVNNPEDYRKIIKEIVHFKDHSVTSVSDKTDQL